MSIFNYHIAHICCCDKCKGQVWSHSQGSWDGHIKYISSDLILDILPQRLSKIPEKLKKQIKMLAGKHRAKLRSAGLMWRKFQNGYVYVGTLQDLQQIENSFNL